MEKELLKACKKYGIIFLGMFGSYSRGENKPGSDLDLLVKFASRKSLLDLVQTERELSERLGVKVDLLTEKAISPYLRDEIMDSLKVIYDQKKR